MDHFPFHYIFLKHFDIKLTLKRRKAKTSVFTSLVHMALKACYKSQEARYSLLKTSKQKYLALIWITDCSITAGEINLHIIFT